MAYEFDPEHWEDFIVEIGAQGDYFIDFLLGQDVDEGYEVVMTVALVPDTSHLLGQLEEEPLDFKFAIRVRHEAENWLAGRPDFTTAGVQAYVPKEHREDVLELVLLALKKLLSMATPKYVTMVTFYQNLPPRACHKYERICDEMAQCCYQLVQEERPDDGKIYWLFKAEEEFYTRIEPDRV